MVKDLTPPVELDELLAAEYNYIAQTANQANEDRARVASFYLIAVGSLLAALFSTQLFEPEKFTQAVKLLFCVLFTFLTLLGSSTVMQLGRLRNSWHQSMLAMNHIKDFAIRERPELEKAFLWKTSTLPPRYKKSSISYFQALEVALISGLMFGAAAFFFQQAFFTISAWSWVIAFFVGTCILFVQLQIYKAALK